METQGLRFTAFLFGLLRCRIPKDLQESSRCSLFFCFTEAGYGGLHPHRALQYLCRPSIFIIFIQQYEMLPPAATPWQLRPKICPTARMAALQTCLPSMEFPDLFCLIEVEPVPVARGSGCIYRSRNYDDSCTFRDTIVV